MKLQCEQCGTQYNVADERIRGEGRVFKFRCRNCDSIITFHGVTDGSARSDAASETPTWYFVKEGQQVGPVPIGELRSAIAGGTVTADTYVWRAGMTDWQPLKEVDELATLRPAELGDDVVRRLETSEVIPAIVGHGAGHGTGASGDAIHADDNTLDRLFQGELADVSRPAGGADGRSESSGNSPASFAGSASTGPGGTAPAPGGDTDLFGDVGSSSDGDIFSSTGAGVREKASNLKHQRHDNSVLFKLDDDDKKGGGKSTKRAAPNPALGGDSGLIDIRSFSKKKKDESKATDLFGDLSGAAVAAAKGESNLAMGGAAVAVPILVRKKKGGAGMIAAVMLGAAAIAGGTTFAVIHFTKKADPPPVAVAPTPAVVPAPEKPAAPAPAPRGLEDRAEAPKAAAAAAPVPAPAPVIAAVPVPVPVPVAVPGEVVAVPGAPVAPSAAVVPAEAVPAAPVVPVVPVEKKELTPEQKKKQEEARKKREEDRKAAEALKASQPKPEAKPVETVKPVAPPPGIDPNKLLGDMAPRPTEAPTQAGTGADVADSLTNGQVNKVMRAAGGKIRGCVTAAGESNVTVTVAFQVTPGGGVSGLNISGTGATGCVTGAVTGLKFPESKNGRSVRIPFTIGP